jgi:hypothetical protein
MDRPGEARRQEVRMNVHHPRYRGWSGDPAHRSPAVLLTIAPAGPARSASGNRRCRIPSSPTRPRRLWPCHSTCVPFSDAAALAANWKSPGDRYQDAVIFNVQYFDDKGNTYCASSGGLAAACAGGPVACR